MRTFFETANTNPFYELDVALSEAAIESADIDRRINMINDTYRVNIACAEHKVLTESGCYSDLEALFEAAEQEKRKAEGGIWASFMRIINNLVATFKKTSTEQVGKKLADEASKSPNAPVVEEGEQAPKANFVLELLGDIGKGIKDICSKVTTGVKESVIGQAISALKNTIGEKVKNFSLKKEGFGVVSFVMSKASELVSTVISRIAEFGNSISDSIKNIGNKKGVVKEAGETDAEPSGKESGSTSLGNTMKNFATWLIHVGSSIVKTIWGAIKKGAGAVKNKVTGKGKDQNAQSEAPANNNNEAPAETTTPAETTAKESVNIFGINFEPEDYTLESALDDDCSEIAALLDKF